MSLRLGRGLRHGGARGGVSLVVEAVPRSRPAAASPPDLADGPLRTGGMDGASKTPGDEAGGPDRPALLTFLWTSAVEVEAVLRSGEHRTTVASTLLAPGVARLDGGTLGLEADIVSLAAPWDRPMALETLLGGMRRRTFLVSAFGEGADGWYDGPLAHVLAGGHVASYLPAGGAAALQVPLVLLPGLSGVAPRDALATEGTTAERMHRCLLGRVTAALAAFQGPAVSIWTDDFGCREGVALVLARQARTGCEMELVTGQAKAEVPPAWRRLCQNLGVRLQAGAAFRSAPPARTSPAPHVAGAGPMLLPELAALLPEAQLPALIAVLNSMSDVLPRAWVRGAG